MRQNAAFVAVLAGAAGLGALLVMPGRRGVDVPAPPPPADEPSEQPSAPPPPKPRRPAPPPAPTTPAHVRVDPASKSDCGEGMVLVDGVYCPYVGHRCAVFEDEARDICATYAPEAICEGALSRRRFCIDIHEYPNVAGVRPAVWVSFDDAKRACAAEGKRLCAAEEWELACEGTGMWPFPYGLTRQAEACNDRKATPAPEPDRLDDPWTREAELARADGRDPAGAHPACASPFGALDMLGNVEEWVIHDNGQEKEKPFRTARKGGSWARGKARCRPIDGSEPGWYRANDLGFRCCSDAAGDLPAAQRVTPRGAVHTKKRVVLSPPPN
ncbi:MAG: SUMF1/EgtB/PvdO family nonheme iron enzyme [Polyangiaceae bacterium]